MPEVSVRTGQRILFAGAGHRIKEVSRRANSRWWAHAFAKMHIPNHMVVCAILRKASARASFRIPILIRRTPFRMLNAETLTELRAPICIDVVRCTPGRTKTWWLETNASAKMVVIMIVLRADLIHACASALRVVKELSTRAGLVNTNAFVEAMIPKLVLLTWLRDGFA